MSNFKRKMQEIIGECERNFGAEITEKKMVPMFTKIIKAVDKVMAQNEDGTKTYEDGLWMGFQLMNVVIWESLDTAVSVESSLDQNDMAFLTAQRDHIRDLCTAAFTQLLLSDDGKIDRTYKDGILIGFQVSRGVTTQYFEEIGKAVGGDQNG